LDEHCRKVVLDSPEQSLRASSDGLFRPTNDIEGTTEVGEFDEDFD
jgi:hypothetical protein